MGGFISVKGSGFRGLASVPKDWLYCAWLYDKFRNLNFVCLVDSVMSKREMQ